jgi:hypothetical protein
MLGMDRGPIIEAIVSRLRCCVFDGGYLFDINLIDILLLKLEVAYE